VAKPESVNRVLRTLTIVVLMALAAMLMTYTPALAKCGQACAGPPVPVTDVTPDDGAMGVSVTTNV
jgi:hypothetical protein